MASGGSASSSGADTSSFTSLYCGTTTGCQSDRCGVQVNGVATPCTPGDPLTHYHHRNTDHYNAAFACMNRMRIHSQVLYLPALPIVGWFWHNLCAKLYLLFYCSFVILSFELERHLCRLTEWFWQRQVHTFTPCLTVSKLYLLVVDHSGHFHPFL